MIFKWIDDLLCGYEKPETYKISVTDQVGDLYSLAALCSQLQNRITKLEEENINTTNCLYEIENRLQSQIDNIHPVTYNLNNYTLDK